MASELGKWADAVHTGYGGSYDDYWQAGVHASVLSQTDTDVTYEVQLRYRSSWGYQVTSEYRIWADDGVSLGNYLDTGAVGYFTDVPTGGVSDKVVASRTVTFERRDASYTAYFGVSYRQLGGYGDGTSTTYGPLTVPMLAPAAPTAPTASQKAGEAAAVLAVTVGATTAETLEVQRQASGSSEWVAAYSGGPVGTFEDACGEGSFRWRARNVNAGGASAWAVGAYAAVVGMPAAPSGLSASQVTGSEAARVTLSVNAANAATLEIQRQTTGGAWAAAYSGTTVSAYTDPCGPGSWRYRARNVNAAGTSAWAEMSDFVTVVAIPPAPTVTAVEGRVNAVVSVSHGGAATMEVERQALGSTATERAYSGAAVASFTDPCGAGTFRWRARGTTAGGTSDWGAWSAYLTVTAPPSVPAITSAARGSDATVVLAFSVPSGATAMEIQRQKSGTGTWETVYGDAATHSYTDSPGAGTWRWRARCSNYAGTSDWSDPSAWVTAMSAPNAPTLTSPASGETLPVSGALELRWRHNPTDGSSQTKARVEVSTNGGASWAGRDVSGAATSARFDLSTSADVAWRVATAGVSGELGAWASGSFSVRVPPQVSVYVDERVTAVPFGVSWSQGSADGSVASSAVTISKTGETSAAFTATLGAGVTSIEVGAADLVPEDGAVYAVAVTVRATTGLSGAGGAEFAADYVSPGVPRVSTHVDESTGAVELRVEATESEVPTASLTVFREDVALGSGLVSGSTVTDLTPPLDRPVAYHVYAIAESGAVSEAAPYATVPSRSHAFFNYGPGLSKVARVGRNLKLSESAKPERETMQVAGHRLPVAMYGEHALVSGSVSGDVWWLEDMTRDGEEATMAAWEDFAACNGVAVMRLPHGEPRRVACDLKLDRGGTWNVCGVNVNWEGVD